MKLKLFFLSLIAILSIGVIAQAAGHDLPGNDRGRNCKNIEIDFPEYADAKITFEFTTHRPCGQFVDGSYWVMAPVTINRISPDFIGDTDGAARHGWAIDPHHHENRFDGRVAGYVKPAENLPLTISNADKPVSIVKATSRLSCAPSCLQSAAVLTIVGKIPDNYSFRPPYVSGEKPIYTISELDLPALPKLSVIPNAPDFADVKRNFNGVWLDMGLPQISPQLMRPNANFGGAVHSTQISNSIATAALWSLQDFPIEKRLRILAPLVQHGIDQFALLKNGRSWMAKTDDNMGHKLPILIAGRMLKNSAMYHVGYTHLEFGATLRSGRKVHNYFSEDGHTYIGQESRALFGATYGLTGGAFGGNGAFGYDHYLLHRCENGAPDLRDPNGSRDGGAINDHMRQIPDNAGDFDCTAMPSIESQRESGTGFGNPVMEDVARPYVATATAARLWGLEKSWNWPAFFAFTERWNGAPWNNMGRNANPYAETMRGLYYGTQNGFVAAVNLPGAKQQAPTLWKPIPGIDDKNPLPGPDGLMRQILDVMYHGGSIREIGQYIPE